MTSNTSDLLREAMLMTMLSLAPHPCLLPLLAVELDASSRVSMVAPIARFGSILDLVDDLEFDDALELFTRTHAHCASDQLTGAVMHLRSLGLDHGDLAVRNVLVFEFTPQDIEVKLADYGETRPGGTKSGALVKLVLEVHALVPR